jgi:hypothetical protein
VKRFVHQRILDRCSDAFQPAFELFDNTSVIECLEKKTWPMHLLITTDFAQTIRASGNMADALADHDRLCSDGTRFRKPAFGLVS